MSELGLSPLMAGDPQLSVADARAAIAAALASRAAPAASRRETVALEDAVGRVLAEDLLSPIDVPAHDNSAMDGYAFDGAALAAGTALALPVAGTVYAGTPWPAPLAVGQALRIMTGAVMPAGADTVVPQELCRVETGADGAPVMHLSPGVVQPGENRRKAGEDLARGRPALQAGRRLRPADVGLVASLGFERVTVHRRLRVALFSTGDELRAPGQPLDPGCIYDSNRASLRAALQRLGCEVLDLGLVPDDPAALEAVFRRAAAEADAVLTSGGVSVGDADHTRALLARIGEVAFWKVAMRPGRPFAFGPLASPTDADPGRRAWLFALPGNPVAALVTFYAFARDALQQLAGATPEPLPAIRVRSAGAIRKRPGRTEFQRGILGPGADGALEVRLTGAQGAGILRSLSEANCLVVLGHEQGSVAAGEPVEVWPFEGLV